MNVHSSKAIKRALNGQKSQKTTAINSQTGSRKNSTFFDVSRDSQKILPSLSHLLPQLNLPSNRKNKQCLKLTVNQNKSHCIQTERMGCGQRKEKKLIFNFCQEVPMEENFYTQIIEGRKTERLELGKRKESILKKRMEVDVQKQDLTLTAPESPINKLIQMEGENKDLAMSSKKTIVEWQRLLQRV